VAKFLTSDPPVSISGKIPKSLADAMDAVMHTSGMSKSELLRRALVAFLKDSNNATR
jgi:metal-responsive CopG/Arc/MetJ family transcriptional regulator